MKLSGRVTADDISTAYEATASALKTNDRISFFAEVDPSMQMTADGVMKDLSEAVRKWDNLKHYYRAALVTDKGWLATLARVEGLVFSSIDVRVFGRDERSKALAWASEVPEPVKPPKEPEVSLRFLQTTNESVFAYEIDGKLREKDIKNAVAELKPKFKQPGKINVLARMKAFHGFDLLSVFDDELIGLKWKAPSKIAKYAIVGAKPWMRNLVELAGSILPTEIRTFESSEEDAAWEWVGAQQALLPE